MKIVTFYSFKGGVGRSTTLANVAYSLNAKGKKVVIADFDIESCGLYSIIKRDVPSGGIFQNLLRADSNKILEEILEGSLVKAPKSDICIVPAGIDHDATRNVNNLMGSDRKRIFNNVEYFVQLLEEQYQYDFLLFDSRAGISNMAEPAFTFADGVVIAYRLGIQQQIGVDGLVRWLVNYFIEIDKLDTKLFLLASNIHPDITKRADLRAFVEMISETKDYEIAEKMGENSVKDIFPIYDCGVVWQDDLLNKNGAIVLFNYAKEKLSDKNRQTMEIYNSIADLLLKHLH
jgi:MinD-like ATPase involved in chromosome partitioning or flagellar assembly